MRLGPLVNRLKTRNLLRDAVGIADNADAERLVHDSRLVGPQSIFVAISGGSADGHLFIDKAVENGAIAVVCEAMPGDPHERYPGVAFISVTDSHAALAELAASVYGDPSTTLEIVGVTGTNGKTTTSFLLHHLLNDLGKRCGLIGTVQVDLGGSPRPATLTTPDALELQAYLRAMRDADCVACVMEVSSHALDQQRVESVHFDAAVFTNLTREHLDYHGTEEAYFTAKKKLFDGLKPTAVALYNVDDPCGEAITTHTQARRIAYGRSSDAQVRLTVIANELAGLRLQIDGIDARFGLVGLFNAYNLCAAYAVGVALGLESSAVVDSLAAARPVPGRFEQISFPDGRTVIVDYAHTPDALENVLQTIQELRRPGARIWCVFGCGGDRDRSKRSEMGRIAETYADCVIVTSDNPRTEDPESIIGDIRLGFLRPDRALWITDRAQAIERAADESRPGDVILVAGKGHETYQIVGTERLPFDDREIVRSAFSN